MKIKPDKADQMFSKAIRLRDKKCVRCHSPVRFNDQGVPVSHQASHFYGRSRESTRFSLDNVDTLCHGCHKIWGSDDKEAYRDFKVKQLGKKGFQALTVEAMTIKKKDRKMAYIIAKKLFEEEK